MISTYVFLLSGCLVIKHFLAYLKKIPQDHGCRHQYVDQIALVAKNSKGPIRVKVKVKIKVKIMVPGYFGHETQKLSSFRSDKVFKLKRDHMAALVRKDLNDIEMFKSEIKKWEPRQCECILCLPYMHSIGYAKINNS